MVKFPPFINCLNEMENFVEAERKQSWQALTQQSLISEIWFDATGSLCSHEAPGDRETM